MLFHPKSTLALTACSRDGSPSEDWSTVTPVLNCAPPWQVALDINLDQTDAGVTEASGFPRAISYTACVELQAIFHTMLFSFC